MHIKKQRISTQTFSLIKRINSISQILTLPLYVRSFTHVLKMTPLSKTNACLIFCLKVIASHQKKSVKSAWDHTVQQKEVVLTAPMFVDATARSFVNIVLPNHLLQKTTGFVYLYTERILKELYLELYIR